MGLSNGELSLDMIEFSSSKLGSGNGTLNGLAWVPADEDDDPSITVYFPESREITAIVLQGGGEEKPGFVKTFEVEYREDDGTWTRIPDTVIAYFSI